MLRCAAVFAVLVLVAASLGFGGIPAGFAAVSRFLFFLFLVAFLIALALGVAVRQRPVADDPDRVLP